MKFIDINTESKIYPGEYLLYIPKREIVLCGAYMPSKNKIKALSNGRMIEDNISNFQKIELNKQERKESLSTRCKGCGK